MKKKMKQKKNNPCVIVLDCCQSKNGIPVYDRLCAIYTIMEPCVRNLQCQWSQDSMCDITISGNQCKFYFFFYCAYTFVCVCFVIASLKIKCATNLK